MSPLPPQLSRAPENTLETRAYDTYRADFCRSAPDLKFQGQNVHVNRMPHPANPYREHSYWHSVTFGQPENERTQPDIRRLMRVPWIHPIIADWKNLKVWREFEKHGGGRNHWAIWHNKQRYVVIVKELKDTYLFVTSYPTDGDLARWHRRFADAKKTGRALLRQDAP